MSSDLKILILLPLFQFEATIDDIHSSVLHPRILGAAQLSVLGLTGWVDGLRRTSMTSYGKHHFLNWEASMQNSVSGCSAWAKSFVDLHLRLDVRCMCAFQILDLPVILYVLRNVVVS